MVCDQINDLFLCLFELGLLLFDSLDEHLPHFLFFLLQLPHELVPLSLVRLLKTDTGGGTGWMKKQTGTF